MQKCAGGLPCMIQDGKMVLGDSPMREIIWNNQLPGAPQTLHTCEQGTTLDAAALGCLQLISNPTLTPGFLGPFWTTESRQRGVGTNSLGERGAQSVVGKLLPPSASHTQRSG